MNITNITVAGCAGRMGRAVIAHIQNTEGVRLAGGFEKSGCPDEGVDIGRLIGVDDLGLAVAPSLSDGLLGADALIDFTAPGPSVANARACAENGLAYIVGTTGFSDQDERAIAEAARKIPIVKSGNMSLGVNLLAALVERAARTLGAEFDIEILDIHHRRKVDAPSGTALMLGEAAAKGRNADLSEKAVHGREGQVGARRDGDIGFAVQRAGGVIGEHLVSFSSDEEIVTLGHKALDRALFARGAVKAAQWAKGKAAGLYTMRDVLGLTDEI